MPILFFKNAEDNLGLSYGPSYPRTYGNWFREPDQALDYHFFWLCFKEQEASKMVERFVVKWALKSNERSFYTPVHAEQIIAVFLFSFLEELQLLPGGNVCTRGLLVQGISAIAFWIQALQISITQSPTKNRIGVCYMMKIDLHSLLASKSNLCKETDSLLIIYEKWFKT